MSLLQAEQSLQVAADKVGMHRETARKYRKIGQLPSELRMDHDWRTRPDAFAEVWPWVVEQLRVNPGLEAKTLLDALQRADNVGGVLPGRRSPVGRGGPDVRGPRRQAGGDRLFLYRRLRRQGLPGAHEAYVGRGADLRDDQPSQRRPGRLHAYMPASAPCRGGGLAGPGRAPGLEVP